MDNPLESGFKLAVGRQQERMAKMQLTMENSRFRVAVEMLGAELASILDKGTGREYLWQGDKETWEDHAPILFPYVGCVASQGPRALSGVRAPAGGPG